MSVIPRKMAQGEHLSARDYNELLDYVRQITPLAGDNVSISRTMGGTRINGTPSPSNDVIKPFHVRYDDDGGRYLIYIPQGSVVLDGVKIRLEEAETDWYVVKGTDSCSGDFTISVHVKGRVTTTTSAAAKPAVTACAFQTSSGMPDSQKVGDVHSFPVASVTEENGLRQTFAGNVVVQIPTAGIFEPYWFASDETCETLSLRIPADVLRINDHAIVLQDDASVTTSGTVYLVAVFSSSGLSASVSTTPVQASDAINIPLLTVNSSGGVDEDRRASLSNIFLWK